MTRQIHICPRLIGAGKGMRLYLDLLWLLRARRGTTTDLCKRHGHVSRRTVNDVCRLFWAGGLIHPCGWEWHGRYWCAVWRHGPGDAPPIPGQSTRPTPPTLRPQSEVALFLRWWELLEQPHTALELEAYTGMSHTTLSKLNEHARARKMVRICDWITSIKPYVALYARGTGGDATRPDPPSNTELNRQYRQRRRNDAAARTLHMVMYRTPVTTDTTDTTAGQPAPTQEHATA